MKLSHFVKRAWLDTKEGVVCPTADGYRYLDEMLVEVLPKSIRRGCESVMSEVNSRIFNLN